MADYDGDYPTVIGPDAKFKGELTFEKSVRIEGCFEGQIKSSGTLHVAEGAKVGASIEAGNVKVEGECHGNVVVSEKLHLMATAKMEGDLRTNRLEIADGAIFIGNVVVGQAVAETAPQPPQRREREPVKSAATAPSIVRPQPHPQPHSSGVSRPRTQDVRVHAQNP